MFSSHLPPFLSAGIADWVIAVIVVGVLAMVALVFCLMGVFFACHTSQSKGGGVCVCVCVCVCAQCM